MRRIAHSNPSPCEHSQRSRGLCSFAASLLALSLLAGSAWAEAPPEAEAPAPPFWVGPLFSVDAGAIGPIDYSLGRGLRFNGIGLNIGGFSTIEYQEEEERTFSVDGISFLILWEPPWEPIDWFSAFMELELDGFYQYNFDEKIGGSDVEAEIERLYGDFNPFGEPLGLRLGKYQTPFGRWNLVPADPFTWTASEPVFLDVAFTEQQTGGSLRGNVFPFDGRLNYWVYSQFFEPLELSPDADKTDLADYTIGGRVEYWGELDRWSLGASFLASDLKGDWRFTTGLDGLLRFGRFELSSEWLIQRGERPGDSLWDIYVQGVMYIGWGFYAVARYEHFDPAGSEVDLGDIGAAWIPLPWLRLKADYRIPNRETDDVFEGVHASFSLVF